MFLTRATRYQPRRRGVILVVVLAMLTLFAIVGISFVLVASAQATSAKVARDAESQFRPDIEPEQAFAILMGQLLYGVSDDTSTADGLAGILSGLRGHDLGRSMYGFNDSNVPNDKPFCGTGKLHAQNAALLTAAMANGDGTDPRWFDEAFLVNYTWFPADKVLRDPERAPRADPTALRQPYTGGFNVPYTYPDHNNFFLALIDPATGQVIAPSFHREYLFGRLDYPPAIGTPPPNPNNINWTNTVGKYLTVRPRPIEHNGFPYPLDRFGDVKNLDGAPGGCDSIWIDPNAPIMKTTDGRRYKMLVAPLILALDDRINLNVVGNLMGLTGGNPDHRSHQGWGVWEINPALVLNANATEWRNLFLGSDGLANPNGALARIRGRYDNNGNARNPLGAPIGGSVKPRGWGQVDYNSAQDNNSATPRARPNPMLYPSTAASNSYGYLGLPLFPGDTFNNGFQGEDTNHARIFNVFRPVAPNRLLPLSGMAPLLRFGGTGYDWQSSDLARLLPTNLITDANALRRRNLVTLHSCDLDWQGATPYIWDPADVATQFAVRFNANKWTSSGNQPIPFPALANRANNPPPGSEFDPATWRSLFAALNRVNLNRLLTPYPAPANTGFIDLTVPANVNAVNQANLERQQFAMEIFTALRQVTGAMDPTTAAAQVGGVNSPQYTALRYLAQVAVNIVDYIDSDGYSTVFNWNPNTGDYVYGVELPRLVLNETYVQYDNDTTDLLPNANAPGKQIVDVAKARYNVNVWVELFNPLIDDSGLSGTIDAAARLQASDGTAIYRIKLCQAGINTQTVLRSLTNPRGDPNFDGTNRTFTTMSDWGATAAMNPTPASVIPAPDAASRFKYPYNQAGGNIGGVGYWVIGPKTTYRANADPNLPTTYLSPNMTYGVSVNAMDATNLALGINPAVVQTPTILLQRLANPALPPQEDASKPLYNPYITVDVSETVGQVWDGRQFTLDGQAGQGGLPAITAITDRASYGRTQPYAGLSSLELAQKTAPANQPKNSFFKQNTSHTSADFTDPIVGNDTLKVPFDWLVHLDRFVNSPIELLHVTDCKPADLTQAFVNATGTPQRHVAPWLSRTARLYRFLEFVQSTFPRPTGVAAGGRVPGRINLNLVFNDDVFFALCDAQGTGAGGDPRFTTADVQNAYSRLITSRSPGSSYAPATKTTTIALGPTDPQLAALTGQTLQVPFWSLAQGFATVQDPLSQPPPAGPSRGMDYSLLRGSSNTVNGVLDIGAATDHPYRRKELLRKIYNNVTTRSNVFAVWLTVGYFEVDALGRLGAEIGKAENRHVRHRMFAIVDRTQMTVFTGVMETKSGAPLVAGSTDTLQVPVGGLVDSRSGRSWMPQPGNLIVLEPNTDSEETVVLFKDANGNLAYTVKRAHPAKFTATVRGNPGPWTRYDPRQDTDVVPYWALID